MISRENLQDLYPLAPMQEGMLFDTLLAPGSQAYREQAAYRLRGAFDVARFEACWRELVRRHEALRTVFVHEKVARPLQMVLKAVPVHVDVVDLAMLAPEARESRAAALREEERARGFDLTREPPSRLKVLVLGDESHEIVWTFHHIILDGWSVAGLMAELLQIYARQGVPSAAALPATTPYARYIQWLEARDGGDDRAWWRERLAGFTGPTSIPGSRTGPGGEPYEAAQLESHWSAAETAAFEAFARAHEVTPSAALQALWAILLSRYQPPAREGASRIEVAFGAVVSGRPAAIPGVEAMVGLFTNTVVLRVAVDDDEPLPALLARVQADALEAQEHAYVPLAQAQPAPGTIDHAIAYENFPRGGMAAGRSASPLPFELEAVVAAAQTPYDLNVAFVPGERLAGTFLFNAARHAEAQVRRIAAQLRTLAAAAIAAPDSPVGALDLVPREERARIESFALTRRERAGPATLHATILAQVREAPDAIAVIEGESRVSYAQLEARSRALAASLARHPRFRAGARVAVVLDRSAELPIAWLAIMRAGGVYLPVDPAFPDERVDFIVRDSGASLVLTTAARIASMAPKIGEAAAMLDVAHAGHGDAPFEDAAPAPCAYVIYTSGSTGIPKGVAVGHAGVLNLMAHLGELQPPDRDDRVVMFASPAFDASIWEMGNALCHGAALVVVDRETAADPARFGALMRRERCTVAVLPPSYLRLLDPDDLASFRLLTTGGEAAHPDMAERMAARLHYANVYGPTEASIHATSYEVARGERFGRSVPIGRPIPNVEALVLDRRDRPAPIGAAGELCLGGVCVALGYVDRPELDRARFTPHPWKPGERIYRTGDIARWLDDGNLEYLGRTDDQVKLRGHRVELGEVQSRLLATAGVRQGAVVLESDEEGAGRLAAFVVLEPGTTLEGVRRELRRALPEFMVPSRLVALERLPLTPQGKLDRAALPADASPAAALAAPADALQAELARLFEAVLEVREVGPESSFFELGGHSLTAVRLVARVRKDLGLGLEVRELFEHPTITALAQCLRGRSRSLAEAIPKLPEARDYAVSHAQKRLWLLHAQGAGAGYNIAGAFRIEGSLDARALEAAAQALVARHEVLRTSFHQVDGEPRQRVHEAGGRGLLECVDVAAREDPAAAALALVEEARSRVFDLESGRPLALLLVREAPQRHLLVVVMHHIVADEWSIEVAARELGVLYAAARAGRDAGLAPLAVQHRDVAAWLDALPQDAHAAYWRAQLAKPLPVLDLPSDRPRPPQRSFRGDVHHFRLDDASYRALASIARAGHATLFMALTAVIKVLLARYTGQDDIVVGHPAAGREHPQLEDQVGFFVNTIALRDRLRPQQSFRELVGDVRRTVLEGLAHQAYPFDRLVEDLGIARDASRHPLFDVMVAYQRGGNAALELEGARVEPLVLEGGTSKFDLLFAFTESDAALDVAIEYSADLFGPATLARLEGHLAALLAAIAKAPDAPIAELSLLTAAEAAAFAADAVPVRPEPADTVVSRFARTAAAAPNAVAVVCGEERLTYGELARGANALARELLEAGVGRDTAVGLFVGRSAPMLVGMVGILEAGAGYLPLDPALPAARLRSMLADARAIAIVATRALAREAAALGARVVVIEDAVDVAPADRLPGVLGDDLAYVLFTSGSTGRPNGVMVEHRNVVALLDAFDAVAPRRGRVVGSALCPFGFDVSVWEIFSALTTGGTVHLLTNEVFADARLLVAHFRAHGINNAYLPPALVDEVGAELSRAGGASLERLLVGVEPIAQGSLDRLCEAAPGLAIVNGYGPTEATVCATFHRHEPGGDPAARVPIGRAARGYEVHLLDGAMQPVPAGIPGEIHVGGAGLARGYAGNAALTARRFVPNPFARAPGERLYRTGDLARRRLDGAIEFLGRVDHQLKVRGFRVEPGEIEAVLRQHAAVREAAVMPREGPRGVRLVACVAADDVEAGELRAFVKARLPDYMVPAAFAVLPMLPRNANGKVDREALARIEPASAHGPEGLPANETEATLLALWRDVLGVAGAGCDDDFFDLGGHSLLATRLLGRIREACGVELPLAELFAAPTVRSAAARVDARRNPDGAAPARIPRVARDAPLPLGFEQQRLWFLEQLEPGPAYNVAIALALEGELDAERLEDALNAVVARHEILRTRFVAIDGRPAQEVLASRPVALARGDLSHLDTAAAQREASNLAAGLAARAFDLAGDALLRAQLLRLAPRRHVLVLVIHHIVIDGWSSGVLMRELAAAYAGEALPPLDLQYGDFAAWQRSGTQEATLAAQVDFWKRELAGLPPVLELPADRPRSAQGERRAGIERFSLDAGMAARVRERARRLEATPFMVLLAAFQALLSRLTGQRDIAVGTPIAHRTLPQVEPLIGFFANTVVLRASFEGAPSFDEAVRRVRQAALAAYAHQDAPFDRVVDAVQPERSLAHAPLFQVLFVLQNAPLAPVRVPGLEIRALEQPATTAKFDLTVVAEERDGAYACAIEYNADLFEAESIRAFAAQWRTLLDAALASPETALDRLPLLAPAERRALLEDARQGATRATPEAVTALVAAQAARTPGAIAIEDGEAALTYAALEAGSNRLANHLRALGAGPGKSVALCVPRSAELLVALLGIVKSGAAVVPLDLSYPRARLELMLREAGVALLVQRDAPAFDVRTVDLDRDRAAIDARPDAPPGVPISPDDGLYILFTSGSTGIPKGVQVPHRVIANLVAWGLATGEFAAPARTLQFTPISFDVSFQEIFGCWASGGAVVTIDEDRRRDSAQLLAFLAASRIERLFLPFVALQGLAEAASEVENANLPRTLRQVVTAGEQLRTTRALADFFSRLDGCELHNHYGPTETHVITAHRLRGDTAAWPALPPIGRPVAGARLYVLDEHLEPVPRGVAGELYAGGVVVARGYVNRPDLTAERFIADPFEREGTLYRTGDRVRLRRDGEYEFIGRADGQLKVRGFRVEPAEIEAALTRRGDVAQAAVIADERQRLIAYVVVASGAAFQGDAIREALAQSLPAYMVPAAIVPLPALPLTPSGKVDRAQLPRPAFAEAAARSTPPRTATERALAAIWAEVLGIGPPGVHESFFELGGHSLLATRVLSRIRSRLGAALTVKRFFESPTIAALAPIVDASGGCREAAIPLAPRDGPLPCSPAQERLWYAASLDASGAGYNMPGALRLEGTLDVEALLAALTQILRRHEVLRTRIVEREGRLVQAIDADPALPFERIDVAPERLRETMARCAAHAFDLARELPVRFALLRLAADDHVLAMVLHHIAADGWSLGVLAREAKALYAAHVQGSAAPLPGLEIQYADYAAWQRERLAGDTMREHAGYWRQQLDGASPRIDWPLAHPRPPKPSFRGAVESFGVEPAVAARLRETARARGCTLNALLFAAYAALLHRLSGADDLVIATPAANRGHPQVEPLIGLFVNLLPIRVRFGAATTYDALARELHETLVEAIAREAWPFEKIVEELAPERSLAIQAPFAQAVFAMQNWPREPFELPGLTIEDEAGEALTAKGDLALSIEETPQGLRGSLEYALDLFDAGMAREMVRAYRELLVALVDTPQAPVLGERAPAAAAHDDEFTFEEG